MGLDFTNIKDHPGSAIYFIHDGTERSKNTYQRLLDDTSSKTRKQLVLMSSRDKVGAEILRFYGLKGSEFILIVRDDDQLHHSWGFGDMLNVSEIAYIAEQAG